MTCLLCDKPHDGDDQVCRACYPKLQDKVREVASYTARHEGTTRVIEIRMFAPGPAVNHSYTGDTAVIAVALFAVAQLVNIGLIPEDVVPGIVEAIGQLPEEEAIEQLPEDDAT